MRAQVSWLTDDEKRLVVDEAYGLLERVGVKFGPCAALGALEAAGARVDREAGVARLPRTLVEQALSQRPPTVLLAGAAPENDVLLDGSAIHFVPSGTPTHVLDFETGEYRPSTFEDLRRSTIVADAMEAVDVMWPLISAGDLSPERQHFAELVTPLSWSAKHLQHDVTEPWHVEPMLATLELLCGSLEAYRERPRVSFVCCTTSPLGIDGGFLDVCIEIARYGAPILVYPMPIAGGTAPVTVAGTVAMNVAEFLGVAAAIELSAPGAPLMMGAGTSLLDMKATTFCFGALETAHMCAACVEIGHFLGIPVLAPGLATDAMYGGIQTGFEKALKGLVVASSGADLITGGIGLLHGAGLMSLQQIVIDGEIATMIKRLLAGADFGRESVMADMIERVGFSGNYLREKETTRRLRAGEHFFPTVATRLSYEMWKADGDDELTVAGERVREIVAAADERGPVLDEDLRTRLNEIGERALASAPK